MIVNSNDKDLKIRPATSQDAEILAEIEALCFPPDEAAGFEDFKNRLEVFGDSFFIGEISDTPVAFVNGAVTDSKTIYDEMYHVAGAHEQGGAYQAIFGLCTHPDFQKNGFAELMLDHIIKITKGRGKSGLILTCKEHLLHYYKKFGFLNKGISESTHGGAVWYDMILEF